MSDRHAVQKITELALEVGKAQLIIDNQNRQIEDMNKRAEQMQEQANDMQREVQTLRNKLAQASQPAPPRPPA